MIDPATLSDADYLRWERIGWLRALISSYRYNLYDKAADEDAQATAEMLREVTALADELEAALPQSEPAPPASVDPTIPY